MNKKGFTLIELLAVIVIFGIILVVAVPEVLGYINKAKKDSLGNGADLLLSGISIVNETALSKDKPNGTYTITNGVIVEENPFSFDKKLSFDGTFTLDNGNISYTLYNSDGLCVSKSLKSNNKKYGVYRDSKCYLEDISDLFIFDESSKLIKGYKEYEYVVNKEICISYIQDNYSKLRDADVDEISSFCDGNDVKVEERNGTVILNLDNFIFSGSSSFIFDLETDGVITITGENPKNIIIPSKINGIDVLSIYNYAFSYSELESVVLPDSLLTIGVSAFEGNKLRTINFPKNLGIIGAGAFNNNLFPDDKAFIYRPDDSNYLVSYAGENRANVVLPNKTTTIGDYAFSYQNITNVTLNEGLVSIRSGAFGLNDISSIVLPSTVRNIDSCSFCETGLNSLNLNEGLTSIGAEAFAYNSLTTVNIPSSVTGIGNYAFTYNKLATVVFSAGSEIPMDSIGYNAFYKTDDSNNTLTSIIYRGATVQNWNSIINSSSSTSFITGTVTNVYGNVVISAN